ncbi:MAG: hypothetical protein KAQ85_00370 [Thermodesulfovibrionia bacterium]|nr:hypothetical protein [Thermodesulfovibrionia bacterium]
MCRIAQDDKVDILKIQNRRADKVVTIPRSMYPIIDGAKYMKIVEDGQGNIVMTPVVD